MGFHEVARAAAPEGRIDLDTAPERRIPVCMATTRGPVPGCQWGSPCRLTGEPAPEAFRGGPVGSGEEPGEELDNNLGLLFGEVVAAVLDLYHLDVSPLAR